MNRRLPKPPVPAPVRWSIVLTSVQPLGAVTFTVQAPPLVLLQGRTVRLVIITSFCAVPAGTLRVSVEPAGRSAKTTPWLGSAPFDLLTEYGPAVYGGVVAGVP